ncbi:HBR413Wp [Eremothecium sinecaudum]|uniref:HBR413Wp n=1 Tax=Eremothecium sinecaudum TaxID=45286 RepID=A0A109UXI2_9SACH|nr:HBR413Wp [Eremothecium sinecaudum]AMD19314.1 HBR413Wp [Eremothecium sinecaudum]
MQVLNLSRLFNISYFSKRPSQKAHEFDYSKISERINQDGYVEVQWLYSDDIKQLEPTDRTSNSPKLPSNKSYSENSDEVDVPISEFVLFTKQLQASKRDTLNTGSFADSLHRRRSAREQQMSRKLLLLSTKPYPNSEQNKLHVQDYKQLDDMLTSSEDLELNDKNLRRSKFISRRDWDGKKALRALKC